MSRRVVPLVATGIALVTWVAGAAWACTEGAYLELDPTYGPPGSTTTVNGSFPSGDRVIQIRWGSSKGPLLAETRGPDFSVQVVIPNVPYDTYMILGEAGEGLMKWKASAPFTVTDRVAPRRSSGQTTTVKENSAPANSDMGGNGNKVSNGEGTSESRLGSGQEPAVPPGDIPPAPGSAGDAPVAPPAAAPADVPIGSGQTGTPGGESEAPGAPGAPGGAAGQERREILNLPAAVRSVSSDLWSGFGPARALVGGSPFELREEPDQPSMPMLAGMVLLGFGGVLGAASMSLAVAHRRRSARAGP